MNRLRRVRVNERKCTIAWTLCKSGSSPDRYENVYTACRGENTACTLIAYGKRVRRPRSFSPARKMANTRTTNYFASLRAEGAHIRINPLSFQELVPRRGPLTRDNTAPTKGSNPYLRYYTRTRIIQGQIWVRNEVKFARVVFRGGGGRSFIDFRVFDIFHDTR